MNNKVCGFILGSLLFMFLVDWIISIVFVPPSIAQPPIYSWRFTTISGIVFGDERGELDLVLHPYLMYVNGPNQKSSHFTINSLGFRGPMPSAGRDRKRLVVVGGSTAFGSGLPNDQGSLAAHLGETLSVEAINAGVIGYRSTQEFISVATQIHDLRPQLVVALNGINDFSQIDDPTPERFFGVQTFDLVDGGIAYSAFLLGAPLTKKLSLFYAFLFPNLHSLLTTSKARFNEMRSFHVEPSRLKKIEDVYVGNMEKVFLFGKGSGFKTFVAVQPLMTSAKPRYAEGYREFARHVTQRLKGLGIPCVNLAEGTGEAGLQKSDFIDFIHLTDAGNNKIAALLKPLLPVF